MIVALRVWTGHKSAATQAWLPSKPLTSRSSRTGISFRQLALSVAPLTRQGREFFPLANGTPFSFPERDRWERAGEREVVSCWGKIGFCIPGLKGLQRWLVTPSGWEISWDGFLLGCLAPTHKPTEFVVQVFAQAVTVRWPAPNHKGCSHLANYIMYYLYLVWITLCLYFVSFIW